jgi:ribosomal protein S3AE
MPYAIRRMVRKGTNYVEDSILTKCKDAEIIVKPFLITRRKVSREVRKALRNRVEEEIEAEFKTKTFEKLFDEILKNSVQKSISLKLKKTYPLSACEIRVLKVKKFLEKEK